MENIIKNLCESVDNFILGKSVLGRNVYGFHIGSKQEKQILLSGGMHAREYISSLFLLKEIEFLKTKTLNGGVYVLPLLNPDGVDLVLNGTKHIKDEKLKNFLLDVNGSSDFSHWKANAHAVDLNVNFDAEWGNGKNNTKVLAKENFIGFYPNSEPENLSIINFLNTHKIDASLAFHSKGEVIYYGFKQDAETLKKNKKIARNLCKINGYTPIKTKHSTGGLSDYINLMLKIPAFTIELGNDFLTHPISERFLPDIFEKNKNLPLKLLACLENN